VAEHTLQMMIPEKRGHFPPARGGLIVFPCENSLIRIGSAATRYRGKKIVRTARKAHMFGWITILLTGNP
jgi:hypothetical protein